MKLSTDYTGFPNNDIELSTDYTEFPASWYNNNKMKELQLTKGLTCMVDDTDYLELSKHKWLAMWSGKSYYAARCEYINGKQTWVMMHRAIVNPDKNKVVDHKNGNTLDNRRENLRIATYSENSMNSRLRSNNTSGVKGLSYASKGKKRWLAQIVTKERVRIGKNFLEKEEAIQWLKEMRQLHHEEFCKEG
jgi:hypothetical protein